MTWSSSVKVLFCLVLSAKTPTWRRDPGLWWRPGWGGDAWCRREDGAGSDPRGYSESGRNSGRFAWSGISKLWLELWEWNLKSKILPTLDCVVGRKCKVADILEFYIVYRTSSPEEIEIRHS